MVVIGARGGVRGCQLGYYSLQVAAVGMCIFHSQSVVGCMLHFHVEGTRAEESLEGWLDL